jgi:hypothetical protein
MTQSSISSLVPSNYYAIQMAELEKFEPQDRP